MQQFTLNDVEKVPPNRFQHDNSCHAMGVPQPVHWDRQLDGPVVDKDYYLIGWSDSLDERFMHNREGQIALLLFHPEMGEIWQHYPAYEEDRETLLFQGRLL